MSDNRCVPAGPLTQGQTNSIAMELGTEKPPSQENQKNKND